MNAVIATERFDIYRRISDCEQTDLQLKCIYVYVCGYIIVYVLIGRGVCTKEIGVERGIIKEP